MAIRADSVHDGDHGRQRCVSADPACRIRIVDRNEMAAPDLGAAISNSFAFGGTNAVLAFTRA